MVKDLVANSPFINLEFIEAGELFNESNAEELFDYYKIDSGDVSFNLNRDFVDYRITPFFSTEQISELNINNFDLDSLSYFQVSEFLNHHSFSSIKIEKSDIAVYLQLPDNYDSYLKNLSKKNIMSVAIFLIGFLITILFIIGQFKEKQTEDKLRIDYKNYYERYNIEREKNPKTKKGSQSRQVKIKIEKTIK